MLHQIQFYDPADPEKRDVIETIDGLANPKELEAWNAKVLAENEVPDGQKAFLVAENNPWFIRQDDTEPLIAISNISDAGGVEETEPIILMDYETCGALQIATDEKRRLAELDRQERLKKHMAAFEG